MGHQSNLRRRSTQTILCCALAVLTACGGTKDTKPGPTPTPSPTVKFSPADGTTGIALDVHPAIHSDTAVIDCSTVNAFTVATQGGAAVNGTVDCTDHDVAFIPAAPLAPQTGYVASVSTLKATDGAVLCSGCTWQFTTGASPFFITGLAPAEGATDVSVGAVLDVTFSLDLDCASVTDATFKIVYPVFGMVSGTTDCAGAHATFTPDAALPASTTYSVTLAAVKSASGIGSAPHSWTFTTKAEPPPPTVSPADGQIGVALDVRPALHSDTAVIDCTTAATAFTFATQGGAAVDGTVDCTDHDVVFIPSAALAPETGYVATISLLKATDGAVLCSGCRWHFTTGAAPFSVTDLSPAEGASDVSQSAVLDVAFGMNLNCATVTSATFTLLDSGTGAAVTGTAACAGAHATFAPAAPLGASETYTATVDAVLSVSGASSAPQTWTFTSNAASKMPVNFLGSITNRWVKAVGADSQGRVIMAYLRAEDATHFRISAQRYVPGTGWGGHEDLGTDVSASSPIKLAVNATGYAVALWRSNANANLYYAYYNPYTTQWSGKTLVSGTSLGAIRSYDVAIDANGNAMASWTFFTGSAANQLFARYYPRAAGVWKPAQELSAAGWPNNVDARFAFDASGNGMIVWNKWRPVTFTGDIIYDMKICSLSYDAATDAWSNPVDLDDGTLPDIGIDATGRAVAVWVKKFHWDDPAFPPAHDYYGLGSAIRAAGGAWNSVFIGAGWDPKGNADSPRLVVTPGGDAMVVWTFWRGNGYFYNVNAAYLPAGAADWSPAGVDTSPQSDHYAVWRVVDGDRAGADVLGPQLAMDASGNARFVYYQSDGARLNVYAMRYTRAAAGAPGSWSKASELDATFSDATGPLVVVDGTGVALTVWNQANAQLAGMNDFWFLRQ